MCLARGRNLTRHTPQERITPMSLPIQASFIGVITPASTSPGAYRLELCTHAQLLDAVNWYTQEHQQAPCLEVCGLVEQMSFTVYKESWRLQRQRRIQRSEVLIHEPDSIPGRAKRKEILFVSVRQEICPPGQMFNPDWRPETRDYWLRPARLLSSRWEVIYLSAR